jgi:hypothetical protein
MATGELGTTKTFRTTVYQKTTDATFHGRRGETPTLDQQGSVQFTSPLYVLVIYDVETQISGSFGSCRFRRRRDGGMREITTGATRSFAAVRTELMAIVFQNQHAFSLLRRQSRRNDRAIGKSVSQALLQLGVYQKSQTRDVATIRFEIAYQGGTFGHAVGIQHLRRLRH